MRKKTLKSLKAARWKLLSEYIRRKYSDHAGYCRCVTCGTVKHWKELHAGHFIPKNKGNAIYFVEENCHPQCPYCNSFLHGSLTKYTLFMIDTYGREKIQELEDLSRTRVKFIKEDHELAILELKQKLDGL